MSHPNEPLAGRVPRPARASAQAQPRRAQITPLDAYVKYDRLRRQLGRRIFQLSGQGGQLLHESGSQLEGLRGPEPLKRRSQHFRQRPLVPRATRQRYGLFGERATAREVGIPAQLLRLQREQARAAGTGSGGSSSSSARSIAAMRSWSTSPYVALPAVPRWFASAALRRDARPSARRRFGMPPAASRGMSGSPVWRCARRARSVPHSARSCRRRR